MLKKFDYGLTVMVLFVVLMIAVATFNVGSVTASSTTTKDPSDLKFVTKYVPGYGNVTAREDMFVGSGDNITVVANKDYKEYGLITPFYEKFPTIDYVTIDSPYGKLEVTPETYRSVGKERLIAEQKAFLDSRNEFIKTGKINPSVSIDNVDSNSIVPLIDNGLIIPADLMAQTNPLASMITYCKTREDLAFMPRSGMQPFYIYGRATPYAANPAYPDSTLVSYHEYEISIPVNSSTRDCVEIISQHNGSGTGLHVWFGYYNDLRSGVDVPYQPMIGYESVSGPIEFYVMIDKWTYEYTLYLYNPSTRASRICHPPDSTRGSSFSMIDASTELEATIPNTWYDQSVLEMWMMASGNIYYNPTDVYSMGTVNPRSYNVEVNGRADNGHYVTTHEDGGSVA